VLDALLDSVAENMCGSISLSFSFCGGPSTFYQSLNGVFAQAATQGQSMFAASGDSGAAGIVFSAKANSCVVAKSGKHPNEIAASPHVTAVGGTQFTPSYDGSGNDVGNVAESAWNEDLGSNGLAATGGGKSKIFAIPSFQKGVVAKNGKRLFPDVAFGAGAINPGFFFGFENGSNAGIVDCCVGGTSIGAPAWAGISALIAQENGVARIGNLNTRLYELGPMGAGSSGLRDVTTGNSNLGKVKGYPAKPGFDLTTGWGTPDVDVFVNAY
jgi:kumamolisin